MSRSPLHLAYNPETGFLLSVKVAFNSLAINGMINGVKYKSLIIEGIEQNWSGKYPMIDELEVACRAYFHKEKNQLQLSKDHLSEIPFVVKIDEDVLSGKYSPRILYLKRLFSKHVRPIPIFFKKTRVLPSHVASGLIRRLWGIFRTGQIESIGYNWSRNFPGFAVIDKTDNINYLRQISAHEAGHLFGVGDAYDAWYRFFYAAPGTENYMMHYNRQVHPFEISMLIKAYTKERAQFFPRKFNLKRFLKGMKSELSYYAKKIIKLFAFTKNS